MEEGTLRPIPPNPCNPSPCGPNSQCQVVSGQAQCGCQPNMIGMAPNCRPECLVGSDCPSNLACVNQKCIDPCPGTCATNADCRVVNHSPTCSCTTGYTGNGFDDCQSIPAVGKLIQAENLAIGLHCSCLFFGLLRWIFLFHFFRLFIDAVSSFCLVAFDYFILYNLFIKALVI